MSDDRRTARRIRLPGVDVTYEGATGERQQARVIDLSKEGLFVPSPKPLAVGKRLSLEIMPVGDAVAWSALGRVVWVREEADGPERPAGMAVKIIDADDAVFSGIQHLLEAREPTDRGLGTGDAILPVRPRVRSSPPARERTMMGVGIEAPAAPPAPAAPILITAPGREPTILGVGISAEGGTQAPGREASLAIDLVTKKPPSVRPASEAPVQAAPAGIAPPEIAPAEVAPAEVEAPVPVEPPRAARREFVASAPAPEESIPAIPKSSGVGWVLLFLLAAGGGAAGYVFRDRVIVYWHIAVNTVTKQLK